jgi:GR25 family glycosyltransferase involved in LPS biosynthesis
MKISLICACKNRYNALRVSLNSWLAFDEIDEIIIVDWNSDEPINHLTKLDSRIKVIRVSDKEYFNQPQPLNLAASIAKNEYLLKVDTDYILNPYYNFFDKYKIDDNSFVSGRHNYKSPEFIHPETGLAMVDKNELTDEELNTYYNSYSPYFKYLTGFLFIKKENFLKVGGYNEKLGKCYAYEDDELFQRLNLFGLTEIKIDFDYLLIHLPHPDNKRTENFEGFGWDETYRQMVKDNLSQFYSEQELEWQVQYAISQKHVNQNKEWIGEVTEYCVESKTSWNIDQIDEQNYFANDGVNSKLKGFPTVYYVSLEECTDRQRNLEKQFEQYNIKPNPLLSKKFAESDDVITGKYAYTLNDGTKGCCVSHLKAIKAWYNNTDEPYGFFCEDDLSLETVEYWNFTWEEMIQNLPEDWESVQLLSIRSDFGEIKLRDRYWDDWSATAYIVKREYAKKLIDTYCQEDSFHLEIPNQEIMPLIENILFTSLGKTYTYPIFVEDINFESTFVGTDDDVNNGQKNNHYKAHQSVLNWWKNCEKITMPESFIIKAKIPSTKKRRVVDCFPYFNEKELLEFRINLLKDHVDTFVIIDANYTHSGIPKDFTCKKTIKDLELPEDKIRVIELDLSDESIGAPSDYDLFYEPDLKVASRERIQRDAIANILDEFNDDDVFIISDCDEIINPNNIEFLSNIQRNNTESILKIPLVHLEARADFRAYNPDGTIHDWNKSMFMCSKKHLESSSATKIRAEYYLSYPVTYSCQGDQVLQDLGWHFSWMGTSQDCIEKFKSFCHWNADLKSFLNNDFNSYDELYSYMENYTPGEGKISPSGNANLILKSYSIKNLPSIIFKLEKVKDYLLPEMNSKEISLQNLLYEYSLDTENAQLNFDLALEYENQGHNSAALSYFLRCAERSDDITLSYEALIHASNSYDREGTRDGTAKGILQQALCLFPERPEAYFLLSRFSDKKQWWQDCYIYADTGLRTSNFDLEPLKTDVEYPGKYSLLFAKSVAGYWWGKHDESKSILLDLKHNYDLIPDYARLVEENLTKFEN